MAWKDEKAPQNHFNGQTLETDIKRWDIIWGQFIVIFLNPLLVVWILFFSAVLAMQSSHSYIHAVIVFLVTLAINISTIFILNILNTFFSSKIKYGVLGKHTFTFTDEGCIEETEFNRTLLKWRSLDRVVAILGYVVVRVSGQSWHIFPNRCFASDQDKQFFIKELKHRIKT